MERNYARMGVETMEQTAPELEMIQIERLAEKVKALVDMLQRARTELETAKQDNAALREELVTLREASDTAGAARAAEIDRLRDEREAIRERVQRMLGQIETIGVTLADRDAFNEA